MAKDQCEDQPEPKGDEKAASGTAGSNDGKPDDSKPDEHRSAQERPGGPTPFERLMDEDVGWHAVGLRVEQLVIQNITTGIYADKANVAGDLVGGDKRIHGAERRRPRVEAATGRIEARALEEIRAVYVHPPGYGAAREILEERRLVVLRGPTGRGKRTMALHLLATMATESVWSLDPDIEIRQLGELQVHEDCGHVLVVPPVRWDGLGPHRLERLREVLSAKRSYLALVIDGRTPLPAEVARDYGGGVRVPRAGAGAAAAPRMASRRGGLGGVRRAARLAHGPGGAAEGRGPLRGQPARPAAGPGRRG